MSAEWYHCRLKPISRSAGRSAVMSAAYRAGLALHDEKYATLRDYTAKKDVVTSFTLAPEDAPEWASDITQLWNRVEVKENRKNSTLAFEWEIALPSELDDEQRQVIARKFAGWLVAEYGVAVTVGIHEGNSKNDFRNHHAHVMMTTRALGEPGWEKNKLRDFNTAPGMKNAEVDRVREYVADLINEALDEAGFDDTHHVTHLSFAARGITDREPTKHLGPGATGRERRGIKTERGDINRAIIEERLAWQRDQAQPEITAELEREFVARFGDEPRPGLTAELPTVSQELAEEPPRRDELQAEAVITAPIGEPRRTTPWGRAWRAVADRARSFAAKVAELWADESGEAEQDTLRPASPAPHAEPAVTPAPTEGGLWQAFIKAERVIAHTAGGLWRNERGSVPDTARSPFEAFQSGAEYAPETPLASTPELSTRAPQAPARDDIDLD